VINANIVDGTGGVNRAKVGPEGALYTVVHPHPPALEETGPIPFRQYFTDDGTMDGSNDMRVNGSSTEQSFYIKADPEMDTYIGSASVVIADAGATLNKFGNISELTNGVSFEWETQDQGTVVIHEGLKTNFMFVRLAGGAPAFGDGTTAFRAANVSGNSEAFLPMIDFSDIFGLPWGMRLRAGTDDKLKFTVRDNITGIDEFDIIGYGIRF